VIDGPVEAEGVGHAGLIDDDQAAWSDAGGPRGLGLVGMVEAPRELGEGVARHVELVGEGLCGGRGRCEPDDRAAGFGPGGAEGTHRGGLAAARGSDRELDPASRAGHGPYEIGLARRELRAVGQCFEQGEVDDVGGYDASAGVGGVGEDALLGDEDAV
jgi:hypothetical protein